MPFARVCHLSVDYVVRLQATSQLDAQLQAAGQHRQQVAALQQAEQELQAELERQAAFTAQQEACAAQQAQQVGWGLCACCCCWAFHLAVAHQQAAVSIKPKN